MQATRLGIECLGQVRRMRLLSILKKMEELGRFFERMVDWFDEDEIVDDAERKRPIVKYLDPDSEYQWKALPTFERGTWEEFKAQAMSSYPAAEEVTKGLVAALKRKIKKIG